MTPAVFILVAGIVTSIGQTMVKAVPLPTLDACKAALDVHMQELGPQAEEETPYKPARFGIYVAVETAGKDA